MNDAIRPRREEWAQRGPACGEPRRGCTELVSHRVAFKIIENWTIWSYECSPTPSGTRVVQRRVAPQGVNPLAQEYVEQNLGGSESFAAAVTQGARTTLDRLKAAAEAS